MAFRRPCQKIKTSAPIKASEQEILKQQIIQAFSLSEEDGNLLVPDLIHTFKFRTHAKEHGVAYVSMDREPLWFLLGKDSTEFIPTVYTLWKKANLLPTLYISPLLDHILMGGANLMTQGVVQKPENNIKKNCLVSITPHICDSNLISFPLAIGRMVLDSDKIPGNGENKAVHIIHIYKDNLWLMGSESGLPKPATIRTSIEPSEPLSPAEDIDLETPDKVTLPPEKVTSLLRLSTIQAIRTLLSTLPLASFPIPSSLLYSSYILPCRPAYVLSLGTTIDIKNSSHKNLTSFLKTLEKEGLLKLKDFKGDLNILSVQSKHPEILQHKVYKMINEQTINEIPLAGRKRMLVRKFWVASNTTIKHLFELCRKDPEGFYTLEELLTVTQEYIAEHSLANLENNQLINLDQILSNAVAKPGQVGGPQSIKRGYIVPSLCKNMVPWYEISTNDEEPVRRKGVLRPIKVTTRGQAQTIVRFFQPFLISPDLLCKELGRICSASASATSGDKGSSVVKVRGKHVKLVVEFLLSQGVPKRYISSA